MKKHIVVTEPVWRRLFKTTKGGIKIKLFHQFRKACNFFKINNHALFLSQLCYESGYLKHKTENLNYSKSALLRVFGKYFKTDEPAEEYARKPEKIANRVYANRMGNGPEKSGDGWKYRGRLFIQTTGKNNYKKLQKFFLGMKIDGKFIDVVKNPDLLLDNRFVFWPAALYYVRSGCNKTNNVKSVTRIINGGYTGLKKRKEIYQKILTYGGKK